MKSLITILLFSFLIVKAEIPDWVKDYGKSAQYSESIYYTGFGMCRVSGDMDQSKAIQAALDYSRSNLAQKIKVSIQSKIMNATEESNKGLSQYFRNTVESFSELQIEGLESKSYIDDEVCYYLSFIRKDKLFDSYQEKVKGLHDKLKIHYDNAVQYESNSQPANAIREYSQCYSLFKEIESTIDILKSIAGYKDQEKKTDDINESTIQSAMVRMIKKPINSLEDASWYIAYLLSESAKENNVSNVKIAPFNYQDTKMSSKFSRYFKNLLESSVVNVAGWKIVQQPDNYVPNSSNAAAELKNLSGESYIITGSYWESGDNIKLMAVLRNVDDAKTVACAEASLNKSLLSAAKMDYKPQNYKEALIDQAIFNKDEIIDGGLRIEVMTNKGNNELIFSENDTMNVYVRVNMPCHIRFVYHMADGNRVLLLNDYFADESKINKWFQPSDNHFVCAEPFGMESLQLLAQTESFPPVKTKLVDGYDIITEDIESFVKTTRGFKKVKPSAMQSEKRLVITTMPK